MARFQNVVTSAGELRDLLGTPSESTVRKELTELDHHMTAFISSSPFLLLGTVSDDGRCDVSPRGDAGAVAHVLDSQTLAIPDWKGNRRADSLRNIIQTGRIGLLFLTPGLGETLRVNGRACVMRDSDILASMSKGQQVPQLGIGVEVEETFFQCAKALIRSRLWDWSVEQSAPPSFDFAEVLVEQTKIDGLEVESLRQQIEESYRDRLY